ncbi:MAG: S41 family peptidase [Clostridia bacterium]
MMKKMLSVLLSITLAFGLCFYALAEGADPAPAVTEKDVKLYTNGAGTVRDYKVFFMDGGNVPYVPVEDVGLILEIVDASGVKPEYKAEGDHAVYSRGAYTMDFDFANDTITFNDFDGFYRQKHLGLVDMVMGPENTNPLFERSSLSIDRYGKVLVLDLKPYGIHLVKTDEGSFVPLQTVSDVVCNFTECPLYFSGDAVIASEGLNDEEKAILQAGEWEWTEDLADFSYRELCFVLDYQYGLKEIHGIEDFDTLFEETGLKTEFLGSSATDADKALWQLIYLYIGDQHSQFKNLSTLSDRAAFSEYVSKTGQGLEASHRNAAMAAFGAAREKAYPDGIPAYEEIGDTAYITFDGFTDPTGDTDYLAPVTEADNSGNDTIRLIQYACSRILREGSPIQNVVLDLSMNGGGATIAAQYVMSAFLGEADFSTRNTMTGAMSDAVYRADTNLDGVFDEKDSFAENGLKLFCIATPISFSCGNLVPCAFRASNKVTMLGQVSGGGSCSIHCFSTAYGTGFQISGYRRFSVMKNGSFYDVDTGAEPHFYISDPAKYYDREALTAFIHGIN